MFPMNLFFSFLLLVLPFIAATGSFKPKALILPVTKDATTLQHITYITYKHPLTPIKLLVDLGAQTLWVDCVTTYNSSTYKFPKCNSAQCTLAKSHACSDGCGTTVWPRCITDMCLDIPVNPLTDTTYSGGVITEDVILIQSTNGSKLGQVATVKNFIFTCVYSWFTDGLPSGVKGLAGLGRSSIALPTQLGKAFGFSRKFGICLSSSTKSKGVIIFGDASYVMQPNIDISKNLIYTPLIINQIGTGSVWHLKEPASEYFIGVKSININGKAVKIDSALLSIDQESGNGGTKISTTTPYTTLETSIYKAVTKAFVKEAVNVTRVASVKPFGVCFSSRSIGSTRVGPMVPAVDLVLQNKNVFWRIFGANSMVQINQNVLCLGFVDGGVDPTTSIVIGAYQIEDNLLQFDLDKSRLGFSSSLLFHQTTCANFIL